MITVLLKLILNIPLMVLRIIIMIFNIIKSIIDSIGGLFLFLSIIIAIWSLIKKDYTELQLYIVAIVFISLIQIGSEFILNTLILLYEKIYIYKIEL